MPHAPEISLWLADEVTPIWRLTEEELGEMGLPPPFWAFAWSGGQGLARWLLDNPHEVAGKRVLDFATGSGLVGIAAMKAAIASGTGDEGWCRVRPPLTELDAEARRGLDADLDAIGYARPTLAA